jgi:dTDP-4-dehydrorhamnose 3,5-epimerase
MVFKQGDIDGVIVRPLPRFSDERGWLSEFFRNDELPSEFSPAMGYVSMTKPSVVRGPHEHKAQTDLFCFMGPGDFMLALWDNRPSSPTHKNRTVLFVGEKNLSAVIVPPGVVHGYKCISDYPGWVINCPDQLYKGQGKSQPADEIRYEADLGSPFSFDSLNQSLAN